MPQKPLSVARQEFIDGLVRLINESGLPAFVMEPVMRDFVGAMQQDIMRQFNAENAQYKSELKKAEEEKEATE